MAYAGIRAGTTEEHATRGTTRLQRTDRCDATEYRRAPPFRSSRTFRRILLTSSRRSQDNRGHHRSAAISHNRCPWQNAWYLWQNVRIKHNMAKGMVFLALLQRQMFVPTRSASQSYYHYY